MRVNAIRGAALIASLGTALTALAQGQGSPPTIEIVRWQVTRNPDLPGSTTYLVYQRTPPVGTRASISNFLHEETDRVTVTLEVRDPDWTVGDPNNPTENEVVFIRFRAFGNYFIAPPEPPPIRQASQFFQGTAGGGFRPPPGQITLQLTRTFDVPLFVGRNQLRLRGQIPMDVQYLIEFGVSNTQDPEFPDCGSPEVGCDFDLLNAIENPLYRETNPPPFADAGPDQTVVIGSTVTLDGSRSIDLSNIGFDPNDPNVIDKDTLTFTWEWVDGPARVDPEQTDGANPRATVVLNQLGTYHYRLIVDDDSANSLPSADSVLVTVVEVLPENRPPRVVITGPANAVVEGTVVSLDATATSDPDGDTLTYAWQQTDELGGVLPPGDFRTVFQPVSGTQTNRIAWQANRPGTYYFRLVVSDGQFNPSARFSVTVIDRATAGYIVLAPRPADDAGGLGGPGAPPTGDASPLGFLAPLCGAGLLPVVFASLSLLLLRRSWR